MLRPLLASLVLAACTGPDATPPPTPAAPRVLADLDPGGRRALCERIVAVQRGACDDEMRSFDALFVEPCAADHPRWSCATIRIADYERCAATGDAAACAASEQQADACGLAELLRRRCPLHVGSVVADGPGARAGLVAGDRVRAVDGEPLGHADFPRLLERIAAGRPLRLTVASGAGTREVAVTPDTAGERARIGVEFTPPPECAAFLTAAGPVPCRIE